MTEFEYKLYKMVFFDTMTAGFIVPFLALLVMAILLRTARRERKLNPGMWRGLLSAWFALLAAYLGIFTVIFRAKLDVFGMFNNEQTYSRLRLQCADARSAPDLWEQFNCGAWFGQPMDEKEARRIVTEECPKGNNRSSYPNLCSPSEPAIDPGSFSF